MVQTMPDERYHALLKEFRGKPEEVQVNLRQWAETMQQYVMEKDPLSALHCVVQMGVSDPQHCECGREYGEDFQKEHLWKWLHEHHSQWNATIWRICNSKPGLIQEMARLLREDLKAEEQMIVVREYGEQFLEGFLNSFPAWLGQFRPNAAIPKKS